MTHDDIRAVIQADPALVAKVHAALAVEDRDTTPDWTAIAAAVSADRTHRSPVPVRLNELSVRARLPMVAAVALLRALRQVHDAVDPPQWLADAMQADQMSADERVAVFDTLQCGWRWLQSDAGGLDVADDTTRGMLALLASYRPDLAAACSTLTAAGDVPDAVLEIEIRRAVLADDGTVRV